VSRDFIHNYLLLFSQLGPSISFFFQLSVGYWLQFAFSQHRDLPTEDDKWNPVFLLQITKTCRVATMRMYKDLRGCLQYVKAFTDHVVTSRALLWDVTSIIPSFEIWLQTISNTVELTLYDVKKLTLVWYSSP